MLMLNLKTAANYDEWEFAAYTQEVTLYNAEFNYFIKKTFNMKFSRILRCSNS